MGREPHWAPAGRWCGKRRLDGLENRIRDARCFDVDSRYMLTSSRDEAPIRGGRITEMMCRVNGALETSQDENEQKHDDSNLRLRATPECLQR